MPLHHGAVFAFANAKLQRRFFAIEFSGGLPKGARTPKAQNGWSDS